MTRNREREPRGDGRLGRGPPDGDGRDPARFRHLVEHIQDAVVEFELVDGEPIVVGANPAFVEVFGYELDRVVGASLNDFIVPPWLSEEAAVLDSRTTTGKVNHRHVVRETTDGLREFFYRGIPYERADGRLCGFAVYTDLTDDNLNESRVEVTNRLLRHNLRNKLNVVSGAADVLADRLDGSDGAEQVAVIREAAAVLEQLTDEATTIRRTLDGPVSREQRVDCRSIVDGVVEQFRSSHPHAEIHSDVPDGVTVRGSERLETAVSGLVENAIVHNPADSPRVWVTAESVPGSRWVELAVADDGPEIPQVEREVVTGEADITPVYHGSGLGLWLVKWTVEHFGGDLSFGGSEAGGNRVRLRLLEYPPGATDRDR